jgi:hypothetical protein
VLSDVLCTSAWSCSITALNLTSVCDTNGLCHVQAKKLEAEVLAPMQRWTTAYTTVQQRMQKLEGVRLEVDSRRRTVAELGVKIDRQRARLPQTRSKGEFEMEQTIKKMQHKENKLAGKHGAQRADSWFCPVKLTPASLTVMLLFFVSWHDNCACNHFAEPHAYLCSNKLVCQSNISFCRHMVFLTHCADVTSLP